MDSLEEIFNKAREQLDEKFSGLKEGDSIIVYFTGSGERYAVHASTKDFKKTYKSASFDVETAFNLANKISAFLEDRKYDCVVELSNLPREFKKKMGIC